MNAYLAKKAVVIPVVGLLLVGGGVVAAWWHSRTSPEARARDLVRAELFDPNAAEFRDVRLSAGNTDAVCGEVNGKNRFGAFVGYRRFLARLETGEVVVAPDQRTIDDQIKQVAERVRQGLDSRTPPELAAATALELGWTQFCVKPV